MSKTPNPGSAEAVKAGCQCPVIDNGHGQGYLGQAGLFVMDEDCPLHGGREKQACKHSAAIRDAWYGGGDG